VEVETKVEVKVEVTGEVYFAGGEVDMVGVPVKGIAL
jgi:hypothetical protein